MRSIVRQYGMPAAACLAVALLPACGGGTMSSDKALKSSVAEAAGSSLSGETLQRWLMASPTRPNDLEADVIVSAWINNALIIDAVHRKVPLDDSVTVDSVIAPDAVRGVVADYMRRRDMQQKPVTDKEVDSLLDLDRVRVFQQILVRLPPNADTAAMRVVLNRATPILVKLRAGADFTAAVKQYSEDSISKAHDGYLPPVTRDELPDVLTALWSLAPGKMSALIPSAVGLHIMRRATRAEASGPLKQWLFPRLAHHADSVFIDSLAAASGMKIAQGAAPRVRAMALEPAPLSPGEPLVTWKGGALSAPAVREAILMLPPVDRFALSGGSDSMTSFFLNDLARRRLVLAVATHDSMPTAPARKAMAPVYLGALDSLRSVVQLLPAAGSPGDAASMYIDSMLGGRRRHLALPGALGELLRNRNSVKVDQPAMRGVVQAAALKWQEKHRNDSSSSGGGVRPAPNGPPVGAPAPGS